MAEPQQLACAAGAVGAIVVDDEMVDEAGVKLAAAIVARGQAVTSSAGKEQA